MADGVYRIDLKEISESFYFLQKPQYSDALYYLTSTAHEYPRRTYYVERFNTDAYMINFTLNGQGRFIYNGISHTLERGTLIFAYMGVHNVFFPLTDDFEYCCFHMHGGQVKNIYRHATDNGNKITIKFPGDHILELFETFKQCLIPPIDFFEISKNLGCLLTDILKYSVKDINTMSPLAHEVYKQVVSNNLSVREIAKNLHFSPAYLEKQFKKQTGESIQELIIKHKLEQAENLLLTTDLSINAIAQRLGYSDTVGLIHLFRKHLDCTPLEFRKYKSFTRKRDNEGE